jgi:hypothetical protein
MKLSEDYKGSVSSGTMRPEDLIPTFYEEAKIHGCEVKETTFHKLAYRKPQPLPEDWEEYYQSEEADWDLESLFDMLDEIAPEGCYFGSHPGDGADYGFWEVEE